jgi:DNA/RNA-binding domain of Phe-tRNA-synthetase-like protein
MLPEIRIDGELKEASSGKLALGVLQAEVTVSRHDQALWREIDDCVAQLANTALESIAAMTPVQALRATYKALGSDPSRYRGSSEALLRRITQGKGLYQVNTVVDINNLVSLESRRSVASYDRTKLGDRIVFRGGGEGESYEGIGKGAINVHGLPVFADDQGAFGSSTSDSQRAMITPQTTQLLMVIIAFDGEQGLQEQLARATRLLEEYATARDVRSEITI